MDEKKPHVYRLSTKVDAVIAATMRGRDDALRRFEEQEAATRQAYLDNLKSVWTPLDYSSLFSSLDLGNVAAALASANAQYAQAVQAQQATTRQMLEVQEMAQGAFAELAHFAVSARSGLDFFIRRYEEEEREACETLGIDIDDPFYADMDLGQFWAEVEAVRWMKEMVRQGWTLEAKAKREELLRTGQLSGYTLSRFIQLVIDTPVAANSLWIPDNHEFEIQVSDPVSGTSLSRTTMTAGARGAVVTVRPTIAAATWQVLEPAPVHKPSRRERNHRLRIIVGLVRWRHEAGDPLDDLTHSDARLISKQTYHNYKNDNLAYTADDIAKRGSSFGALWNAYRNGKLEQAITEVLDNVDET